MRQQDTVRDVAQATARFLASGQPLRVPPGSRSLADTLRTFRFQRNGQDLASDALPLRRAARGETVDGEIVELIHGTGERRILLVRAVPLIGSGGKVAGAVCAAADVTDRHDYETRLRLLLDELNHRVKNTLAIVQSIATLTTLTLKSVDSEVCHAFVQRPHTLAAMRKHWFGVP